jgi:ferrochelatase
MKIETLTNLIGGELINRPYISEVVHFTDNVEEVRRGSCFFAKKISDIPQAIKSGAYAIISEQNLEVLDKEIAWIIVDSFKKAIYNIFKYENLKHKIYVTDEITLMIINAMNHDKRVVVLKSERDFLKAINLTEKFLIMNEKASEDFANIEELKKRDIDLEYISIFKSRFNNTELNLPYVYKDSFAKAYDFFEKNELKYSLEFELERFKPVFVNSFLEEVEYGKSDKVVICGIKNDEVFFDELNYIIENTKHAKIIFTKSENELTKPFNFAVAVDYEFKPKEREEKGLFDD